MKPAEKLSELFDNRKFRAVLLAVIIILQIVYDGYVLCFVKAGYHSDEMWSYGFANCIGEPTNNIGGDPDSDWYSRDQILEYITASPGHRFRFDKTYYNSTNDIHPPFYFFILHFICSLFPGKFSPWFAFVINALALAGTQIYLFLTACEIFREKKYLPYAACLLFALCRGSMDSALFLRMYALFTFFTISQIYYQIKSIHSEETKDIRKNLILCFVTCYLGFMTQNFYPMIGGMATFMVCLWLLCHKKIKRFFIHGFTMLGSVILYVVTYPSGIKDVLDAGSVEMTAGGDYPFITQFRSLRNYSLFPVNGVTFSVYNSYAFSYISAAVIVIVILSAPLCFLFRNETWFKDFLTKVKLFFKEKTFLNYISYDFWLIFAVFYVYLAVGAKVVNIIAMGNFSERYVFNLFPLVCLMTCMIPYYLFFVIKPIRKAGVPLVTCVCIVLGILTHVKNSPFLNNSITHEEDLKAMFNGQKVQFITLAQWMGIDLYPHLTECDSLRIITVSDYANDKSRVYHQNEIGDFYLILPCIKENLPNYDPDREIETSEINENTDSTDDVLENADQVLPELGVYAKAEDGTSLNTDLFAQLDDDDIKELLEELSAPEEGAQADLICNMMIQGGVYSVYRVAAAS